MAATGHNGTLCVIGTDGLCEQALIAPDGTVFLPNISIASEGIQYLTLPHYNMKQVVIFLAAKGGYFSPFPYTHQACPYRHKGFILPFTNYFTS